MYEAGKALATRKMEIGFRTTSIFLKQPLAEGLRGRDIITMLDFGCGDSTFTIGAIKAVAARCRPRLIQAFGINADEDNGGYSFMPLSFGRTSAVYAVLEPVALVNERQAVEFRNEFGIEHFDMVTLFNPGPPDGLLDMILAARKAMMAEVHESSVLETLKGIVPEPLFRAVSREIGSAVADGARPGDKEMLRRSICDFLIHTLDVPPEDVKKLRVEMLLKHAKHACLEKPLRKVIPNLLGDEGKLFMAYDELFPVQTMRQVLASAGYEIEFERENEPRNILGPGITSYNAHLLGATLPRSKHPTATE